MKKVLDKIQESQHFDKIYDHIILILKNLNSLIKYQSESTRMLKDKITELEKKQSDLVKELASTKMASNVGGNQMAAGDLSIKSDKTPQQAGSVNYALNGVIFASRDEMYAHHKSLTKEQMDAEERAMYSQQGNGFIYIE